MNQPNKHTKTNPKGVGIIVWGHNHHRKKCHSLEDHCFRCFANIAYIPTILTERTNQTHFAYEELAVFSRSPASEVTDPELKPWSECV